MEPLCDRGFAALNVRFIVPVAICGILNGEEPLDDIAEYTIQEILSELAPDAALLALALCARNIGAHVGDRTTGRILKLGAEKIIEEYGPVWLAYEAGQVSTDAPEIALLLSYIPEDLECLGDLLLSTGETLDEDNAVAGILCDILGKQAEAHRQYAEAQLNTLELELEAGPEQENASALSASNVIPFPPS